jgi:hypothetical protein
MGSDILIVSNDAFFVPGNIIQSFSILVNCFKQYGLKVDTQIGLDVEKKSRCVFNHVDLTTTPKPYIDYFKTFPNGINTSLVDIRKSLVCHESLVTPDDSYQGAVIVKTNLNCGGAPERRELTRSGRLPKGWIKQNYSNARFMDPGNYPIFKNVSDVPPGVWENPNLIVQQFRTEMDDHGRYCLRYWYVLGSKGFHTRIATDKPIVKGSNILDRQLLDEPIPPALLQAKERLGVDFGRFDYIVSKGEAILFDVNRTPCIPSEPAALYKKKFQEMSMGVFEFLC